MAKIKVTGGVKVSGQLRAKRFNTPPAWDTIAGSLGTPFENQAFTVTPGATDPDTFPDANITYSLVSGSLPSGLTLNSATSEISGTPAAVGSDTLSNFTLRAADGQIGANKPGKFDERDFSITVLDNVAPSFDQAADFSIGSVAELAAATLFQITATDPNTNPQAITFSEVGAVLTGDNLSLDANGNVTGTPPDSGGTRVVTFTVRADDGTLTTDQDYKLTITDSQDPIWVTAVGLLVTVNESEAITTITLVATDDNAVSYSVTSGALPGGLTLNSSNGEITGTPSNVAEDTTSDFEVTATDTVELDFTARCFSIKVLNVIANSLRFNDDDSAHLSRTPSASNRDTWTFSTWFKRGNVNDASYYFFVAGADVSNLSTLSVTTSDAIEYVHKDGGTTTDKITTTAAFRDPSAWYHLVLAVDTTQGTEANRIRLYMNGTEITDLLNTNYPAQNVDTDVNSAVVHYIGRRHDGFFFDGYMSETYFVDGSQLTPTDFGAFDSNGDWQPKEYSGGFGSNGFRLDFAVAPGTGDGGGTDVSGNANHFTDSGLAANDQVPDTPTNNHATFSPLTRQASACTLTDGNKTVTFTGSTRTLCDTTMAFESGQYVMAFSYTGTGADDNQIGWETLPDSNLGDATGSNESPDKSININGGSGNYEIRGNDTGTSTDVNDEILVAIDRDANLAWIGIYDDSIATTQWWDHSGTQWRTTDEPALGTNSTSGLSVGKAISFAVALRDSATVTILDNDSVSATLPAGFLTLNTANLPTPTIEDPSDHYETLLYTGNSSNGRALTGLDFSPDFVWIKNRSNANGHQLYDAVRGVNSVMHSDDNTAEVNPGEFTSFDSGGFTLGTADDRQNTTGFSYVAWNWNESATPGFDIITYTGTGVAHTEAHSLGAVPDLMIVKARDNPTDWFVYHSANTNAPETDFLRFNTTAATADSLTVWNDTAPTSTVFSVGTSNDVNANNINHIAYLWAEVESFSRFGGYTGNGSADGPFVWCGFRPAYLLLKRTDIAGDWLIMDSARDTFNIVNERMIADSAVATSTNDTLDFLSNGFKLRESSSNDNATGGTYIFAAWAESPFKTARAR